LSTVTRIQRKHAETIRVRIRVLHRVGQKWWPQKQRFFGINVGEVFQAGFAWPESRPTWNLTPVLL
jgi:hypothetical protein